jgi:sugar O-acyltransferase (sialic acid O-acetyltransferase NeuD family)
MAEEREGRADILIYGGGGHGRSLLDLLHLLARYRVVGIVDDGLPAGEQVMGLPVLGGASVLHELRQKGVELAVNAVGGVGAPQVRISVFERLKEAGFRCPALVHPAAFVEPSARLAEGAQILPRAYIGTLVEVGFGVIVNNGAIVSHDCRLGDYASLAPGAVLAGGVDVGRAAQIGMGVTVNLGLRIGENARIGNSAVVKADVPAGGRVKAGALWPPQE